MNPSLDWSPTLLKTGERLGINQEKVIKVNGIKDYARLNLKHLILAAALILAGCVSCKESCSEEVHIKVNRIWESEKHCAFTSLTRFEGRYYVAFREAGSHIFEADGSARGQIRILESRNGRKWKPVACLSKEGYDLRDPSLSVTPDGRLLVSMGGSIYVDRTYRWCNILRICPF